MRVWVVDTSPLIFLAKLDRLDLLRREAERVVAPPVVLSELRGRPDEAFQKIEEALGGWLEVEQVQGRGMIPVLLAELDPGEAEVVALAQELGAERVVMDDLDARRFARRVGLVPVGTLGLLLAARLRGEIPSLRNEIQRLRDEGFRAGEALLEEVLKAAGEWERGGS
ncbi:MAG TPA: DUF3368 domain-containing protein [Thermoanaerobaculia bacterium]|nr:DUF3368 domain-containing protein [Thermoanaerobaculia bacterium]